MSHTTRRFTAGVALLLIGLSLATAVNLTAPHIARANPGVHHAAPTAQGNGDCSNWDNACTLRTALDRADSGDEVWVKAGVHYPGAAGNRDATFQLKNGVAIYGGFAGTETQRTQRNWQTHITVLSGDIDRNDIADPHGVVTDTANIQGENAYHVVTGSGTDDTAVLDGFIISAGQADTFPDWAGGGMYNKSGSPTLTNITFSGNMAETGGGMYNSDYSSPTLTDVTFSGNMAETGGGMSNSDYSSPTLTDVTFSGNMAETGGGMSNSDYSSPTLTDVTFSGNSAGWGGGMYNSFYSSPTLTDVTFSGNSASLEGGGMYNQFYSEPTLTNVAFHGNSAEYGGGMYNKSGSPTLTDVTFSSNSANDSGGGMYNDYYSSPTLTDVTFSDNSAGWGGGMYNSGSSTLTDVTFSGNSAGSWGGGMYNNSSPTLTDVIFSGNSADYGGGMFNLWDSSSPTLTNVTFSGNTADEGGGMYNLESRPTLTNVTFSGNTANHNGGGMFNVGRGENGGMFNSGSPTLTDVTFSGNSASLEGGGTHNDDDRSPTLINVILWGNSAPQGPEIYNTNASTPTISYSDIQGCGGSSNWNPTCGEDRGGNIDADPRFVGPANGNLRLRLTSPAIDAGNNAAVPSGITTDLDGNPRFVDIPTVPNTGHGTPPIVDMGAYEAQDVQYVDMALGKAVLPPSVAPGQAITFTLALTNTGSLTATDIIVTDTLPAWLGSVSITSNLTITDTGHTPPYVWRVQDLAPGGGGVITVHGVLTVPLAAGVYSNTAVIAAAGDLLAENNTAVVTFTVTERPRHYIYLPLVLRNWRP